MGQPSDKRKQSLYFPEDMLREIQEEATRQDRSLSWIVQQAWRTARAQIARTPGVGELRRPDARVAASPAAEGASTRAGAGATGGATAWKAQDERTRRMPLVDGGADWIEVRRSEAGGEAATWRVLATFGGNPSRIGDVFDSCEAAQGCALLLAMRRLPALRRALHEQLDLLPGAWWWKILPVDDASAEPRAILSDRVADSEESAEQSGRAAGAGWYLYVYGPGSEHALGRVPA